MKDELKLKMLVTCVDMADTYDEARQMTQYIITGEEPPTEEGDNLPDLHADLFKPSDFDKLFPNGIRGKFDIYPGGLTAQSLKEKAADPAADIYIIFKDGTYRPWSEVGKELAKLDTVAVASVGLQYKGHTFAVALHDLPEGRRQILKDERNEDDNPRNISMFEAVDDFDAQAGTDYLRQGGLFFNLPQGLLIPTVGMMGAIFMLHKPLDEVLVNVDGDAINYEEYWTSTTTSANSTYYANLRYGKFNGAYNLRQECRIRPVMDFKL